MDTADRAGTGAARVAATILWVLVLVALTYGIFNTGKSVVDLFTG